MTDAELICQARETHPEAAERCSAAWNTLAQRYLPLVWRYAYALLQDSHAAEDVVSEAMLAFLKNIRQIDTETPKISAWLRSVVRHKVADHHRRTYRDKDHLPRVALEHEGRGGEQQRRGGSQDPSASLVVAEKRSQISGILEGLPERQRLALEWKYVEGMRVREIATRLGETEKAVEATLYRARREFRRVFEQAEATVTVISGPAGNDSLVDTPWQAPNIDLPKK